MKKTIIIIISVIIVLIIAIFGAKTYFESNLNKLVDMKIGPVDFSTIEDGEYTGKYSALPISVEVKVTVRNKSVTDIKLIKHQNGQGKGAEVIPQKVIEKQSLDVDTISGATYSSKVILKAIENAVTK